MNRSRFIAAILSTFLILGCQVFTPVPEQATKVKATKVFPPGCSLSAVDSLILVSDLDDTVKKTNVLNSKEKIYNALASKVVFAGMPELYQKIRENYPDGSLMFLSGSPFILEYNVCDLLNNAHFPDYKLTLRGWKELRSSPFGFKMKYMEQLYGQSKSNFILVGDDTECDPEVYETFSSNLKRKAVGEPLFSEVGRKQVHAIYIHRITGRQLPDGCSTFVTAYDIALREFKAGRLCEDQAADVGKAVKDSEEATLLPDFQYCPKDYENITGLPETLVTLKKQIENNIDDICCKRGNDRSCEQRPADRGKAKKY